MLGSLVSCDKVAHLTDKAKGLLGDGESSGSQEVDVVKVDEEEGKEIISTEKRMVVVEFYTDT